MVSADQMSARTHTLDLPKEGIECVATGIRCEFRYLVKGEIMLLQLIMLDQEGKQLSSMMMPAWMGGPIGKRLAELSTMTPAIRRAYTAAMSQIDSSSGTCVAGRDQGGGQ